MIKKTLLTLGLLAVTTLSGCIVAPPRGAYVYAGPGPICEPVVVAPVFGFYGGYHRGWGGYRGGYGYRGYHGGGHWR